MEPFCSVSSVVTPLDKVNVDTDQIIPKQFLKLITKSGFGKYLFFNWRYDGDGNPDPGFVLNDPRYGGSRILAAGENFGCGSSREHAVWALRDYGFCVVIAPSFADIFYSNCLKNGILPIVLGREKIRRLRDCGTVGVDLEGQTITAGAETIPFEIDADKKKMLLGGLDDITQTMQYEDAISGFEKRTGVPSVL